MHSESNTPREQRRLDELMEISRRLREDSKRLADKSVVLGRRIENLIPRTEQGPRRRDSDEGGSKARR
jgi:hypothetical protein